MIGSDIQAALATERSRRLLAEAHAFRHAKEARSSERQSGIDTPRRRPHRRFKSYGSEAHAVTAGQFRDAGRSVPTELASTLDPK